MHLLASSSLSFASNSLLGGYFGKLEGSHGSGLEEKNCKKEAKIYTIRDLKTGSSFNASHCYANLTCVM